MILYVLKTFSYREIEFRPMIKYSYPPEISRLLILLIKKIILKETL